MKIINHKISLKNKTIILELLTFQKEDRKIFRDTFKKYQQINQVITKSLRGTRRINFPDALSESIFCLDFNCGKILSAKNASGYSTSFDCFDPKTNKRIQLKCSASTGPSSFGPRSEYDDIDNLKVNKSEKLTDQQDNKRRPRFDIRLKIIQPLNLQPVFVGKI